MAAKYTRNGRLNINASVRDEVRYRLRVHGKFTAYEVQDGINLTRRSGTPPVTITQCRSRISKMRLHRVGSYYGEKP